MIPYYFAYLTDAMRNGASLVSQRTFGF